MEFTKETFLLKQKAEDELRKMQKEPYATYDQNSFYGWFEREAYWQGVLEVFKTMKVGK